MFPPPSFYAHRARNLVEAANPKDHLIPTSTYNTPDISIRLDRVARSITITQGEEQLLHYDFRSRQATTHSEDLGALLESAERHLRHERAPASPSTSPTGDRTTRASQAFS